MTEFLVPTTSPFREILLGFEWLIVFFSIQFSITFFRRGFQLRNEKKDALENLRLGDEVVSNRRFLFIPKEFGWSLFFLGFGFMEIFFIIGDFYTPLEFRMIVLYGGYLSAMIAFWVFTFIIEFTEYQKSFHFYTYLFLGLVITIVFMMIFAPSSIVQNATFVIWVPVIVMLVSYLIRLYRLSKHNRKVLFNTFLLFIGFILISVGFLGTTDIMMREFGDISRLIGDLSQNGGLIVLVSVFHILPSFEEYEWKDALYTLYVMDNAGRNIYFHQFRRYSMDENSNEVLISGSLTSIKLMLESMTQEGNRPYFINVKGISVMLAYGKYVTFVLFVDRFLYTLRAKQEKFIEQFELTFNEILENWTGELTIFNPTRYIIDEIFT